MANAEHLEILRQGVDIWNDWRESQRIIRASTETRDGVIEINLRDAARELKLETSPDLQEADLQSTDLIGFDLVNADLFRANLRGCDLSGANLTRAELTQADLRNATARNANFTEARLINADLSGAGLSGAKLTDANLHASLLDSAKMERSFMQRANLYGAYLSNATLCNSFLDNANLSYCDLRGANLSNSVLVGSILVRANLSGANLSGCHIYGISTWDVITNSSTIQQNLKINLNGDAVAVDNIEVAQFVYLLLNNAKLRDVIDTVGKKGVLLLGRFTEGRIEVLERLSAALRKRGYIPIIFNFDKPETKDFTETVRLLAGLSKFVIADITNPKSSPLELQAMVPETMVPFQPIIKKGETPFAMLQDLWIKHRDWVLETIEYSSVERLIETMDAEIIVPAEARFAQLVMRRAETLTVRCV
ncbi:pentapeptide repeat-containing protein [Rhizobium leguminosarum]|uniref:pentapeptide repeat-containing protein n=1 Tax=Rhizobium leguminosarum TaxID=384 RepID=UPI001C97C9E2|nr:pentapeptide repeat-containing protein [Rhizobium leguminosarum]MBY5351300.1 pentapeptide repeat-containing protein [Rhizobium leguminosarum]